MPEQRDKRGWILLVAGLATFMILISAYSIRVSQAIDDSARSVGIVSPAERQAQIAARKKAEDTAIAELAKITDYDTARWHPIHFKPAIGSASNAQCLVCHKEVLSSEVREKSPAGLTAAQTVAWYQTLDTYQGPQLSFHARHLTAPYASEVMNLSCNFCHQGHDPREEAPGSSATTADVGKVTLRKQVDPQASCLMCHGPFPTEFMEGLDQPWHNIRENFESAEQPNGCLTCHEQMFRTKRHNVNYLNAANIEALAKTNADVCFGCHGGRAWYRTTYPYPRHPWPDMPKDTPAWAKSRLTESDARHTIGMSK